MTTRYQEMDILSASPEALVLKMYDGAIRFALVARERSEPSELAERGAAISRALAIVSELRSALDFEVGGEMARNLADLYAFVSDQLIDAHVRGNDTSIDAAVRVLQTLRSAWAELAANPPSEKSREDAA